MRDTTTRTTPRWMQAPGVRSAMTTTAGALLIVAGGCALSSTASTGTTTDTAATGTTDSTDTTSTTSAVTVSDATITINEAGQYVITGSGSGWTIAVSKEISDAVTLILESLGLTDSQITSGTTADVTITTTSDSSIASSSDVAISSEGALTFTSEDGATLTLSSDDSHAVKADSVTVDGANLDLTSTPTGGIHTTTAVSVVNGSDVTITAADDGIQVEDTSDVDSGDFLLSDSTLTITSEDKGVTVSDELAVESGEVTIVSGDESLEGRFVNLTGGTLTLTAGDDGINAKEWTEDGDYADEVANLTDTTPENPLLILVDGATVVVTAAGDGFDSNGSVEIDSGIVTVSQSSQDNAALDYDETGTLTGGTVWFINQTGMAQAFTSTTRAYLMSNVSGSAGDTITVTDSSGTVVATTTATTATTAFGNVVFSTEGLVDGEAYTITVSSGSSATATATTEAQQSTAFGDPGAQGAPADFSGDGTTPPTMPDGTAPTAATDGATPPALPDVTAPTGTTDGSTPPAAPDSTTTTGMTDATVADAAAATTTSATVQPTIFNALAAQWTGLDTTTATPLATTTDAAGTATTTAGAAGAAAEDAVLTVEAAVAPAEQEAAGTATTTADETSSSATTTSEDGTTTSASSTTGASDGDVVAASVSASASEDDTDGSALAHTGADSELVLMSAGLLGIGGLTLTLRRRRAERV